MMSIKQACLWKAKMLSNCVVSAAVFIAVNTYALEPNRDWANSYSVGGSCYCTGQISDLIKGQPVETPAGIQTVEEVCKALGEGPGVDEHPIYNTIQCGHGPELSINIRMADDGSMVNKSLDSERDCPGRVDMGVAGCKTLGPKWDLSVFALEDDSHVHDIPAFIEAEDYSSQSGIKTLETSDDGGGHNVGYIQNGDFLEYRLNVPESGRYAVELRVASRNDGSVVDYSVNGSSLGMVHVPNTSAWQKWTTIQSHITLNEGLQTLRLDFSGNNVYLLNINWINLSPANQDSETKK